MVSNAENVSIWWRHHDIPGYKKATTPNEDWEFWNRFNLLLKSWLYKQIHQNNFGENIFLMRIHATLCIDFFRDLAMQVCWFFGTWQCRYVDFWGPGNAGMLIFGDLAMQVCWFLGTWQCRYVDFLGVLAMQVCWFFLVLAMQVCWFLGSWQCRYVDFLGSWQCRYVEIFGVLAMQISIIEQGQHWFGKELISVKFQSNTISEHNTEYIL